MNYRQGITPVILHHQSALVESGWWPFFEAILGTPTITAIDNQLINTDPDFDIYPSPETVFNSLVLTSIRDVKVVIIGQDPYHTPGCAHGLAFSVPSSHPYRSPPSLINIFKEVRACGYKCKDDDGDLTLWSNRGVLLINTALTVLQGKANSHKSCWEIFTTKLFEYLATNVDQGIVIMWGKQAQSYAHLFPSFYQLKCAHPSPMAGNQFSGNRHFELVNKKLVEWGRETIDWNLID